MGRADYTHVVQGNDLSRCGKCGAAAGTLYYGPEGLGLCFQCKWGHPWAPFVAPYDGPTLDDCKAKHDNAKPLGDAPVPQIRPGIGLTPRPPADPTQLERLVCALLPAAALRWRNHSDEFVAKRVVGIARAVAEELDGA